MLRNKKVSTSLVVKNICQNSTEYMYDVDRLSSHTILFAGMLQYRFLSVGKYSSYSKVSWVYFQLKLLPNFYFILSVPASLPTINHASVLTLRKMAAARSEHKGAVAG